MGGLSLQWRPVVWRVEAVWFARSLPFRIWEIPRGPLATSQGRMVRLVQPPPAMSDTPPSSSSSGAGPPPAPKKTTKGWLGKAGAVRRGRRLAATEELDGVSRRAFALGGLALLGGGLSLTQRALEAAAEGAAHVEVPVRPPSALEDDASFRAACIRCGLCGTVCENGCIRYFGLDESQWGAMTPWLDVRRRSCTLCMRCTEICPTGALTPVADDLEVIAERIDMGVAEVTPEQCISYLGRICGYCHDACPLPGKAIKLAPPAKPIVVEEGCVGCGRCVELCPASPTAIRVVPTRVASAKGA